MSEQQNNYLDDPRLTAYALDQLPDDERAEVQAWLDESPEAQAAVDEIRQVSGLLRRAKLAEPSEEKSTALREAVLARPTRSPEEDP